MAYVTNNLNTQIQYWFDFNSDCVSFNHIDNIMIL